MPRGSVEAQPIANEADAVGFVAAVLADWIGSVDPKEVATALNQLASRITAGPITLLAAGTPVTF